MESSSIVSFNNDAAFQSTLKGDCIVSVHELALHAMRDRCLLLQRRINALETDNMRLKLDMTKVTEFASTYTPLQEDEKYQLHQKVAELTKQKSHLMHHVFMVTCENKSLWDKISNFNKVSKMKIEASKHAPLLRSNTYIHNTNRVNDPYQEKYAESSLEEISLKLINSYIQEKSQLVEQYEQMSQLQGLEEDILNLDSIGFTYIEEPATDSLKEIHNQTEKLMHLKKVLSQQEQDLKLLSSRLGILLKDGYKCPSCIDNIAKNVSSEHKEIETSDSLTNFATPANSNTYNDTLKEMNTQVDIPEQQNKQINGEIADKVCPMCGAYFGKDIEFDEFLAHVQNHFTGESDSDSILDNFNNL